MKKFLLIGVAAIVMSFILTACQSKEESYISELRKTTEKIEKADGLTEVMKIAADFEKKMRSEYGNQWTNIEKLDLHFTDEQKIEIAELFVRMEAATTEQSASTLDSAMGLAGSVMGILGDDSEEKDKESEE